MQTTRKERFSDLNEKTITHEIFGQTDVAGNSEVNRNAVGKDAGIYRILYRSWFRFKL